MANSCSCTAKPSQNYEKKKKKKERKFITTDNELRNILFISIMLHQHFSILWNTRLLLIIYYLINISKHIMVTQFSLEKAMAPHSSTLAWKIPWTEEPSRMQSMGSLRVGHDWATSLSLFTFTHWRRKWQPTPVFLPGESQGCGSLVGCRLWGCTESDMTEET